MRKPGGGGSSRGDEGMNVWLHLLCKLQRRRLSGLYIKRDDGGGGAGCRQNPREDKGERSLFCLAVLEKPSWRMGHLCSVLKNGVGGVPLTNGGGRDRSRKT